ncbi:helix-turn-helix transcriptional regulator [Arthrobacter sp. MDB2-24]
MQNSIRDVRAETRISQRELAEELNVSRQTINSIETGRYDPSLSLALAIARYFQRPVEEIFHAN